MVFANPRHFGRRKCPETNPKCSLAKGEIAWALFQHRAAYAVTLEVKHLNKTVPWLAKQLGENADWLLRKLRGHAPADLGEILQWALVLGVHVLPPIDDVDQIRIAGRAERRF